MRYSRSASRRSGELLALAALLLGPFTVSANGTDSNEPKRSCSMVQIGGKSSDSCYNQCICRNTDDGCFVASPRKRCRQYCRENRRCDARNASS